jgi:hypothetical protein
MPALAHALAEPIFRGRGPISRTIPTPASPIGTNRLPIHRNNDVARLVRVMAARYPVVRKLLWDDTFSHVAGCYVNEQPQRSQVLRDFGDSFPQFLRSTGTGAAVSYLADIAELEAACTRALHAAGAEPAGLDAFDLPPDRLTDMRFDLHPSVILLKSRFPIVSVWEANLHRTDNTISSWQPEAAMIARPRRAVEVRRISEGEYEFVAALAGGLTVGAALTRSYASTQFFDPAACFAMWISANVITKTHRGDDSHRAWNT